MQIVLPSRIAHAFRLGLLKGGFFVQNELLNGIKGIILDMDGVLWQDQTPLLDLPSFFRNAAQAGQAVILATNNSTKTVDQYIAKLFGFGVDLQPSQIVNSSMATAYYLKQQHPQGGPVYIVGENGLIDSLAAEGFFFSEDNPIAVIAAMDRQMSYPKLSKAALFIRSGVPFIGTNPDRTFPTPNGLVPGSGAVLAFLEAATYVKPLIMGKPERFMFDVALQRMGLSAQAVLAVGDRMDTDVLGGQRAGCRTAAVLSGVSTYADISAWQPAPDMILENVSDLFR
jgi:4-nitrophenyl phosphatase